MARVAMETILNTTADEAWSIISCFSGAIKYLPAVVRGCREGNGAGSVRTIELANGTQVIEKLERIESSLPRSLAYSMVASPLPIEKYFATMKVQELDNGRCLLLWSSTFTPRGISDAEAVEIVRGIYRQGFRRLEELYDSPADHRDGRSQSTVPYLQAIKEMGE